MKNKYSLNNLLFNILFLAFIALAFQNSALAQCPSTAYTTQYMCSGATVGDLVATASGGTGIGWYSTSTGGTQLLPTASITIGNTYYLDNASGTCLPRIAVLTKALSTPTTSNPFQGFCGDANNPPTLASIQMSGNNIRWYTKSGSLYTFVPTSTVLISTNYYARSSSTDGKCELGNTAVVVNVNNVAPPTSADISSTQLFCSNTNPKISDISVNNGIEVIWYPSPTSTEPLNDTDILVNGSTYYAAAYEVPCQSTQRYATTVTIITAPNAGEDGVASVCQSGSPIDLFNYLTGSPQTGGSWSGGLTGGDKGTFNPSALGPGVYIYTYTKPGTTPCPPNDTATVTVTVSAKPVISNKTSSACSGNPFTVTPTNGVGGDIVPFGTTYTWTVASNPNVSGQSDSSLPGNTTISQTLINLTNTTQTVIYTVTPNISGCIGNTFTVTVSVTPKPSITNITAPAVCSGTPFTVTPPSSGNIIPAGTTYTWSAPTVTGGMTGGAAGTSAPNISGNLVNSTNTVQTAAYTVTPSSSPGCSGNDFTVIVTVKPTPSSVGLTGDKLYCKGAIVPSISFSNSVSGTTYAWTNSNTAIGLAASGSNSIPSFTTTNSTSNSISGTISVIATANGCSRPAETFKITVNPSPNVTFSPAPQTICSGSNSALVTLSSPTTGVTFSWTAIQPSGITGVVTSGTGPIPSQTLINTSTNPITITYIAHATTNDLAACIGNDSNYTITVNPAPSITQTYTPSTCSGIGFSVTPANGSGNSIPSGTTYSWNAPSVTGGITGGASANNQANISGNLTNPTNTTQTATYNVTPTVNGCPGTPFTVKVTVNPKPFIANITPTPICSGTAFSVTPSNGGGNIVPAGTTYTWTVSSNPNITGQSNSTATNITTISQILTNITNTAQTLTYTVTPSITGCTGNTFTITVTVNPKPSIANKSSISICSATTFSLTPQSINGDIVPTGTLYTWTSPVSTPAGAITGGSAQAVPQSFIGGQQLTNTTTTDAILTYTITPSISGCNGNNFTVTVTVKPTPNVSPLANQTYCNGVPNTGITFNSTINGATFAWTNNNPAIGLAANGNGNISAFTPTNTTNNPITATISVVATANGCIGNPTTFDIIVNPSPIVNFSPANQSICSGSTSTLVNLTSPTPGVIFSWTCSPPTGITGITTSGTDKIPAQTLTNSTNSPIIVTYIATAKTSGSSVCNGLSYNYTITVNPKPIINEVFAPLTCSGASFTITPANSGLNFVPAGTTYSWSIPSVTGGITGGTAGNNQSNISGTLSNPTNTVQTATYTITPSLNGCLGNPFTITVSVNPKPFISNVTPPALCSGNAFNVFPSNGNGNIVPTGTTYTWTVVPNSNVNGESNSTIPNTSISQTLINTTSSVQTVIYTVTPSSGNCSGNTFTITVLANPAPLITDITPAPICSGTSFSALVNNGVNIIPSGTVYTWGAPVSIPAGAITGGSAQSNQNSISQTLTNTTNNDATLTYTVTPSTAGCIGNPFKVIVTVKPTPSALSLSNRIYCNGVTTPVINFSNSVTGTTYAWTNSNPSIGLAASGNGNIPSFTPINTTNNPIIATISVIATANGCSRPAEIFTITVNPTPILNFSQSPQTICSGTTSLAVDLTSSTPNVNISWTCNPPPTGITGVVTSGSNTIPAQNLTNNTKNPIIVTYMATITTNDSAACNGQPINYTITVNPTPTIINTYTTTICSNSSFTVIPVDGGSNLIPTGTTYSWNAPVVTSGITGGIAATNQTEISGTLTNTSNSPQTATYTVTPSLNGCQGNTFIVNVNVNPNVNAGIDSAIDVCTLGAPVNLIDYMQGNPQAGGAWTFNSNPFSGTFNPTVNQPGEYVYTVHGISPCSDASAKMIVSLKTPPNAGTNTNTTVCSNTTLDLYPLLGNADPGGNWSPALASGTGIFNPAIDNAGTYTYKVSNVIGCQDSQSTITVSIQTAPNPGTDGTATVCKNSTTIDLFTYLQGSPDSGGTWNPALTSGTGVFDPSIDIAGDYIYTIQGISPCGPATAKVTVNVNQPANAGSNATVPLCKTDNPVNLYDFLGSADSDGTWSPQLASGTGVFDPNIDVPGTYVYTVLGKPGCSDATASVIVTLQKAAYAGDDTSLSLCQDSGSINLFNLLGGTPDANGTWNPPLTNNNVLDPATLTPGFYEYIYTVLATSPCTVDATAKVSINISAPANPGTDSSLDLCQNGDAVNLSDSLGTHDFGGTWNPDLPGGDLGTLDPKTLLPGTYEYTYTVDKSGCPSHGAKVTVTILLPPNAGTDGIATICEDGGTVDLFTYLGGTPQSGGTWTPALASGTGIFDPTIDPAGDYKYSIIGVSPCLDSSATVSVTINPILHITGGTLDAADICPAEIQKVNISGIAGLSNETYTIGYSITGANTSSGSQDIQFTDGSASLFLDGNLFMNSGDVTISFTQFAYPGDNCPTSDFTIAPVTFNVLPVPTPEIKPKGNIFCNKYVTPTIADLTANISNNVPVTWYDAATGGNILTDATLLEDGITYYAAGISTDGCENPIREAVTIKFICDIIIPDGFSPNGDGINDTFSIQFINTRYPDFKIEIFNRYGNIVYKGNKSTPDWDGKADSEVKFGDSQIPTGVYFYIIEFNDGERKPTQGRLYLSR